MNNYLRVVRVKNLSAAMHPVIFFDDKDEESRAKAWRRAKAEMAANNPARYVSMWRRPAEREPISPDVPIIGERRPDLREVRSHE